MHDQASFSESQVRHGTCLLAELSHKTLRGKLESLFLSLHSGPVDTAPSLAQFKGKRALPNKWREIWSIGLLEKTSKWVSSVWWKHI